MDLLYIKVNLYKIELYDCTLVCAQHLDQQNIRWRIHIQINFSMNLSIIVVSKPYRGQETLHELVTTLDKVIIIFTKTLLLFHYCYLWIGSSFILIISGRNKNLGLACSLLELEHLLLERKVESRTRSPF